MSAREDMDAVREPMQLAYGYLVALVNHGGETQVAATKARDHLREAIRRLDVLSEEAAPQ